MLLDDDEIARALAARRPRPARDFEGRLRSAAARPQRAGWMMPAALAVVVAGAAVVVMLGREDREPPAPEALVPPSVPAPAGGSSDGGPVADTADLLAPYQALLDCISATVRVAARPTEGGACDRRGADPSLDLAPDQSSKLRDIADELARTRALLIAQRDVAQVDLRRALERSTIDTALATALHDRLAGAEGAIRRAELAARIAARAVLTPAQRTALASPRTVAQAPSLTVNCHPAGARVTVDGRPVGDAPVELTVVRGAHSVRCEADGYLPAEGRVDAESGRISIDLALKRRPPVAKRHDPPCPDGSVLDPFSDPHGGCRPAASGKLRITARVWANVFLDGKRLGATPVIATVAAGKHHLLLERGGEKQSRVIEIGAGSDVALTFSFPDPCLSNPLKCL